jgi:predicted DNA-binding transcriptional regulator AlpA
MALTTFLDHRALPRAEKKVQARQSSGRAPTRIELHGPVFAGDRERPGMSSPLNSDSAHKVRLSMREGATRLGCSPRHFYDLAYRGEIPTYIAAGHRWVDEQDIDAYLARCKAAGPRFRAATGKRRPGRPKRKAGA